MESGVILLFLAMVVWTQFRRASDPEYDVNASLAPVRWLPFLFVFMAVIFSRMLRDKSPLLGIEIAAGLALSLMHPVNALCFMAHLTILRPWEIEVGNSLLNLLPRLTVVTCLLSYLIHPKQRPSLNPRKIRSVLFLIAFSGWLLLTIAKVPGRATALLGWFDGYFKPLIAFAMALFFIESEISVREFELTLVVSSLSLMANGLYQFLAGETLQGRLVFGKSYNKLGDPNDMGAMIVMAIPFILVPVFRRKTNLLAKAAASIYAAWAAIVVWLTQSRGTMLAIVAQFLLSRVIRDKKLRFRVIITACLLGVGYVGLIRLVPRDSDEMEASQNSRLTFWKSAVNMAVHNPILGVGFNQYPERYMSYVVGTVVERGNRTAHSSWFLALGESGFIGFFFFLAFFVSVARVAWRNRAKRPAQMYALVGYGVAMSFLSHTYSPFYYLLMGLLVASNNVKERVTGGP